MMMEKKDFGYDVSLVKLSPKGGSSLAHYDVFLDQVKTLF